MARISPDGRLFMDPSIGRFGHEVSGMRLVTHADADRAVDDLIYGPGILGRVKKLYHDLFYSSARN